MPATVAPPGWVTLYTLFDVGETIDLAAAERRFAEGVAARRRPRPLEAQTIRIPEPPLIVTLHLARGTAGAGPHRLEAPLQRLSVRLRRGLAPGTGWSGPPRSRGPKCAATSPH